MPIFEESPLETFQAVTTKPEPIQIDRLPPPKPAPTFGETLAADYRRNNLTGAIGRSWYNRLTNEYEYDPSYNPLTDPDFKGDEHLVATAGSKREATDIVGDHRARLKDRETLAESSGLAQVISGLGNLALDPVQLLMIGTQPELAVPRLATRLAIDAAWVAGAEAVKEVGMHQFDTTRTVDESAMYVGGAAILSPLPTIIKAAAARGVRNKVLGDRLVESLPAEKLNEIDKGIEQVMSPSGNAGAAVTSRGIATTADAESVTNAAKVAMKGGLTPNERLATTSFPWMNKWKQDIAVDPFSRGKNYQGVANEVDAETAITRQIAKTLGNHGQEFLEKSKSFANSNIDGQVLAREFERLGIKDIDLADVAANPTKYQRSQHFSKLVSSALRNGDASAIPEIKAMADHVRQNVLEPLGAKAMERGMFDETIEAAGKKAERGVKENSVLAKDKSTLKLLIQDEKGALAEAQAKKLGDKEIGRIKAKVTDLENRLIATQSKLEAQVLKAGEEARANIRSLKSPTSLTYLHRIWNTDAVMNDSEGLRKVLIKNFTSKGVEADYVELAADDVINALKRLDKPVSLNELELTGKAAPLKERLLMIDDNEIAPWLINDLDTIVGDYTRKLTTDIEFHDRFGGKNMERTRQEALALFNVHKRDVVAQLEAKNATEAQINAAVKKLDEEYAANLEDIEFLAKKVQGNVTPGGQLGQLTSIIKKANYLSLMGNIALNNAADIARLVVADGFKQLASVMIARTKALLGSAEFKALTLAQKKEMGYALEQFTHARAQQLGDVMMQEGVAGSTKMNKVSAGLDHLNAGFTKASGMNFIANTTKEMGGTLIANRIARNIGRYDKLPTNEKAWLARHYIDEEMAKRFQAEIAKYGVKKDGFTFAQIGKWTDTEARDTFANATWKALHNVVITPSAGNVPKWVSSNLGSLLMQFQSFNFAAHEAVVMAGINNKDANLVVGLVSMILGGFVVAELKNEVKQFGDVITGKKKHEFLNLSTWVANAIDASGVTGIALSIPGMRDGMNYVAGVEESKRYRGYSGLGSFLGPTYSRADMIVKAAQKETSENGLQKSTIDAVKSMLPYQNMFYLRWLFDMGANSLKDATNAK